MVQTILNSPSAIGCINDTTRVGVNIFVIGRNSNSKRLFLKCGLYLVYRATKNIAYRETLALDGDVGGLEGRVQAVSGIITIST